ncbi:hypothetical protein PUN28_018926 [Cardiocondyla obscurior]|uniref:Uncharacterized protein n=1 Tax=Cardiocondyla obscurior TaxID=286306 RepID=A0AAW2EGF8_9HYME
MRYRDDNKWGTLSLAFTREVNQTTQPGNEPSCILASNILSEVVCQSAYRLIIRSTYVLRTLSRTYIYLARICFVILRSQSLIPARLLDVPFCEGKLLNASRQRT